jgi:hypothetical protein
MRLLTTDRYDFTRQQQEATQTAPHFALPKLDGPVMPTLPESERQPVIEPVPPTPPAAAPEPTPAPKQ